MEQTNISQLSIIELKALAYDQLTQLEISQQNLKIINQELNKRIQQQSSVSPNTSSDIVEPLPLGSIQRV